jgi:hypothetical protein
LYIKDHRCSYLLCQSVNLVVHTEQEGGDVVDLLVDTPGPRHGLEHLSHLLQLLVLLEVGLLRLLVAIPDDVDQLENGCADIQVPAIATQNMEVTEDLSLVRSSRNISAGFIKTNNLSRVKCPHNNNSEKSFDVLNCMSIDIKFIIIIQSSAFGIKQPIEIL